MTKKKIINRKLTKKKKNLNLFKNNDSIKLINNIFGLNLNKTHNLFLEEYNIIKNINNDNQLDEIIKNIRPNIKTIGYGNEKNRYSDILPCSKTMVKIGKTDDIKNNYINANYINGFNKVKQFIACQGPKQNTIIDFWQMIWEQKVPIIVMLTDFVENNIKKCEVYFPLNGEVIFGKFKIICEKYINEKYYEIRDLKITYNNETRKVKHYKFLNWPDHGVPKHKKPFLNLIDNCMMYKKGSIVVHCSAGVGRTGTFIGTIIGLDCINNKINFTVLKIIEFIRKQRNNFMIQKGIQYKFILNCLKIIF
jgi:protein tyrosine phosphatase